MLLSPLYAGSASRKASRLAVVGGESSLEELGRAMPRPRPRPLGRDDIQGGYLGNGNNVEVVIALRSASLATSVVGLLLYAVVANFEQDFAAGWKGDSAARSSLDDPASGSGRDLGSLCSAGKSMVGRSWHRLRQHLQALCQRQSSLQITLLTLYRLSRRHKNTGMPP